jgi:hypothetical protein
MPRPSLICTQACSKVNMPLYSVCHMADEFCYHGASFADRCMHCSIHWHQCDKRMTPC